MNLKERALLVDTVGSALSRGEHTLTVLPDLIRRLLEEEVWKEFETQMGKHVTYTRFEDFVITPPLDGLGTSLEIINSLIGKDEELRATFYATLRRPNGGDRVSEYARQLQSLSRIDIINSAQGEKASSVPNGTSKAYALQKLSDEGKTELLEQIKSGKLSANAAMKQAGYRRPRLEIAIDNPLSAAKSLHKNASPEFLEELKRLL